MANRRSVDRDVGGAARPRRRRSGRSRPVASGRLPPTGSRPPRRTRRATRAPGRRASRRAPPPGAPPRRPPCEPIAAGVALVCRSWCPVVTDCRPRSAGRPGRVGLADGSATPGFSPHMNHFSAHYPPALRARFGHEELSFAASRRAARPHDVERRRTHRARARRPRRLAWIRRPLRHGPRRSHRRSLARCTCRPRGRRHARRTTPHTGPSWHARRSAPRRCTTCSSFPASS